jgi:DNA-binding SARP family transcriptional activator
MLHVSPPIVHGHERERSTCCQLLSASGAALQAGQLRQALTLAQEALPSSEQSACAACQRLAVQQLASISSQLGDYRQAALYFLRLQQLGEALPRADVRELSALSYQLCMALDQSAATSRWLETLQQQLSQRLTAQERQLRTLLDAPEADRSIDAEQPASHAAVDFQIRCLGQLAVYRHGRQLALPRNRKAELILKYLVMYRDRPVARDVLMELGWPELAPDAAANNLNTTISLLRNTLAKALDAAIPGTPIVHEDGAYSLNPALNLQIDIAEFDRCYAQGRAHERAGALPDAMACYQAALDLYQGDLLLGDLIDDRTVIERERLTSTFLLLLGKIGHYHLEQGCYEEAIDAAHRLLKHDPCREDAHRTLMRSFARLGQRSRALHQYELCRSFLQRELEIEPAAATLQLCQRIARGEEV